MTRFLVIDGYSKAARDELEAGGATIAATLYERMLLHWAPEGSSADILFPADDGIDPGLDLEQYDGIIWTGCSLCVNDDHTREVRCQIDLQRRAFAAGVPASGTQVMIDLSEHFPFGDPSQPAFPGQLVGSLERLDVSGHPHQHVLDDVGTVDPG